MYLVHDKHNVIASGFPDKHLAEVYAHLYINLFSDEGVSVSKDCNQLNRNGSLQYVGQQICPFTGESTSKLKEIL